MVDPIIQSLITFQKEVGIPWTVISKKTKIDYQRMRHIRYGKIEPTISEVRRICTYRNINVSKQMSHAADPALLSVEKNTGQFRF